MALDLELTELFNFGLKENYFIIMTITIGLSQHTDSH